MAIDNEIASVFRYADVTEKKSGGATYTPKILADFVAQQIIQTVGKLPTDRPLRLLDPAVGHGELLVSILERLTQQPGLTVEVYGFETDAKALDAATERLGRLFPHVPVCLEPGNFLDFVIENFGSNGTGSLFRRGVPEAYDLIIANPPYVRTQVMGAARARLLAEQFHLTGRVDLYYAFILSMSQVLKPDGVAGIIISNRFMSTKSGASVRQALFERFNLRHAWDLGDTKLFEAAVLPAVLLVEGKNGQDPGTPAFTSIYQTRDRATETVSDPLVAVKSEGVIKVADGRCFKIRHGKLDTSGAIGGVWRIATDATDIWLATVEAHAWGTFRDIGRIRVGVKTCADKVFILNEWQDISAAERPELLKLLTTHHIARRFKPLTPDRPTKILYPHEVVQGRRRAVDLTGYPRSQAYFEAHRSILEGRQYVIDAGREWYEIWVPQDPDAWNQPKLVFRDIAEEPTFWIDLDGSVVNGDCYWLACEDFAHTDLLWLAAAVGNSTFIERFYDLRFHNKLYAGRRRFITQYVEKFPLPDPHGVLGKAIIANSKFMYDSIPSSEDPRLQKELDALVWQSFGLAVEEIQG